MKKFIVSTSLIIVGLIVGLILFFSSVYVVHPNESAIVVHLGKAKYTEATPGLHFHAPFIESAVKIYTGDMLYDVPTSDVITADKKSMIADDYIVWYVTDPTKYYQTLGAVQGRAEERIEAAVYNATKNTISSMTQDEIIAARGDTLTDLITTASNKDISQYGIVIELAEIKALDLPEDNKAAVYERMISERSNIAAGYIAGSNGISWKTSRIVFDTYQSKVSGRPSIESISTRNAEYYGWRIGSNINNNHPAKQAANLLHSIWHWLSR